MSEVFDPHIHDRQTAAELSVKAAQIFQPRTPISTRALFSGRWEQMTTIADAVGQSGLHIVIFGERGVGKTSLSNVIDPMLEVMDETVAGKPGAPRLVAKINAHQGDSFGELWKRAFTEVWWVEDKAVIGIGAPPTKGRVTLKEAFGVSDAPTIDEVRRTLGALKRSVFIFDEFDRGSAELRAQFTDLIKTLSDYATDTTIVIVGVSDTVDNLIRDHASISRAIVQIQLYRMKESELGEILDKGATALGLRFEKQAASLIVSMSQGLPHYTHLIGLHTSRHAVDRLSRLVTVEDVHASFPKAVKQAEQSIQHTYLQAVHSARKDALYAQVILACAAVSSSSKDALGYFHPADVVRPLSTILKRNNVKIATFQKHINEFCLATRGPILEREGSPRAYKYRFHDPLLPPYIFMTATASGAVDSLQLSQLAESE